VSAQNFAGTAQSHLPDEQVDWPAAERVLGTSLPSDYRAFMSVFGAGDIGELGILGPVPVDYLQWDPGSILHSKPTFQDLWGEGGRCPRHHGGP
jgi:hypothetical protein